jgi:SAM-dependent methyltransferase
MAFALYAVTIFLSAFLLFQVQPVIAKMILPWFGGSAAVWTTCMLFFQTVLLLGYLYVYWGVRMLSPKRHAWLHGGLLAASLIVLPIIPGAQWKPQGGENPSIAILLLLAACVGFPYFLLSTTSPLLQSWYARTGKGVLPYRLFALSNLGSMLALISYPALVEPFLASRHQGLVWSTAYAVFVLLCAATAWRSIQGSAPLPTTESAVPVADEAEHTPPSIGTLLLWIALAACPSALLLSVTNHLTGDVAAIPFLWIVPLVLYLLSFILCFDADGWYIRPLYMPMLIPALGGMSYLLYTGTEDHNLKLLLSVFSAAFFICCMFCHGEMVKSKPDPKYLTSFYLMLSIGGALGGLFVGIIAPYTFPSYFEFPISIVLCGFLAVIVLVTDPTSRFYEGYASWSVILMVTGVIALCVFSGQTVRNAVADYMLVERNFYGSLRIRETGTPGDFDQYRTLLHGAINHGEQWIHPSKRRDPLSYYCPATGVGLAIRTRELGQQQRVGVFGLGAGSIAGYSRPNDFYKFYEINPLVLNIARNQFFYLSSSPTPVEVAIGDARLSLEREPSQQFDILAVDCFSGDSIPVHLVTRQAVELYFSHLKPNGILAMHTSNRYLDLEPVLERIATALGKATLQVETEDDDEGNCFGSTWVLIANKPNVFEHKAFEGAGEPVTPRPGLRVWTDDYSSLLSVVK